VSDEPVDLAEALARFDEPFAPRIVGRYNGNKLRVETELRRTETEALFVVRTDVGARPLERATRAALAARHPTRGE